MSMVAKRWFAAASAVALCCAVSGAAVAGEPTLSVYVSIPPQAWVVRRVGGDAVRVGALITKGQDPHTFDPTPQQVQQLSGARVYFTAGLPFERILVGKLGGAGVGMDFVDSVAGIVRRSLSEEEGEQGRQSGGGHSHEHGGSEDPHMWLSTSNLSVMASNVAVALTQFAPEHAGMFESNRLVFAGELEMARTQLAADLAPLRGRTFYAYHPSFGYFADEFGMRQRSVEIEGKSPTSRQLAALIKRGRSDGVKLILIQPQFSRKSAEVVAEALGAAVVPVDPMAEDVIETLKVLSAKLSAPGGGGIRRE
jgi:zinc transport system substrate-binding protein